MFVTTGNENDNEVALASENGVFWQKLYTKTEIDTMFSNLSSAVFELEASYYADSVEGYGRNLLDVFNVNTIAEAIAEIRRRCNNSGQIDNTKIPDFRGIIIGDYIDLPSINDGTTNFIWNDTYKNLRIIVSGFNTYKNSGNSERTNNHILFMFRNCVMTRRMNSSVSCQGYKYTELRTYLNGDFATGLKAVLGGGYLYSIDRLISEYDSWGYTSDSVLLPTEYEVMGAPVWSGIGVSGGFVCQWPIYRHAIYKCKRFNGSRTRYWLASQEGGKPNLRMNIVEHRAIMNCADLTTEHGISPAFCVC